MKKISSLELMSSLSYNPTKKELSDQFKKYLPLYVWICCKNVIILNEAKMRKHYPLVMIQAESGTLKPS